MVVEEHVVLTGGSRQGSVEIGRILRVAYPSLYVSILRFDLLSVAIIESLCRLDAHQGEVSGISRKTNDIRLSSFVLPAIDKPDSAVRVPRSPAHLRHVNQIA